jgi:dihydrofolate reductase
VTERRDREGDARRPLVSLIVAMDRNRVIGAGGRLPWHIPEDLKRFRRLTLGHHIVMGRKTWASIRRSLPGRTNIVVTRDRSFAAEGAIVAHSLEAALAVAAGDEEVFVIGGGELYAQALPLADRLYITEVHGEFVGDTWFPEPPAGAWHEVSREHHAQPGAGYSGFDYVLLERVAARVTGISSDLTGTRSA